MTEENVKLARGVVRDLNALFELFDDEMVWDNRAHGPLDYEGVITGKESVVRALKKWVGTWSEYRFEIDEAIDAGSAVVLAVSETGRGAGSGLPLEHQYGMVWTFENGRLVRAAAYPSKAEALAAAGLSE